MKLQTVLLFTIISAMHSWAIWVPTPASSGSYVDTWEPPGSFSGDSGFTWIEIPDVGFTVLPRIAAGMNISTVSTETGVHSRQNGQEAVEQQSKEKASATQQDITIPRFNDVSCDGEYGMITFKDKAGLKYSGGGISAKGQYEKSISNRATIGVRVNNEYIFYSPLKYPTTTFTYKLPKSDFLLIGGFFRQTLSEKLEVGCQTNFSILFREKHSGTGTKIDTSTQTDLAINPSFYGIYNFTSGPASGYAGGFAGYQYSSFSFSRHMLPYALLLSGGMPFGEKIAGQMDIAASHQFVIIGAQAPVYFSRYFSLTPGIKYPIVFSATKLMNLRITVGVSSRF